MCWRSYPLSIRFTVGRHVRGIPTCELSTTTLAAVQRMVCRAHMLIKKEQARQEEDLDRTDRYVTGRALAIHFTLGGQGLVFQTLFTSIGFTKSLSRLRS